MKKSLKFIMCVGAMCAVASVSVLTACGGGEDKISLNFDTAGGSTISSVELSKDAEYTLPVPTKDGYAFEGWYVSSDFSGSPVTSVVAATDATYYAKWSKLYAINLELDGGSLSQTTVYVKAGANVYDSVKALVPTKSGLKFGAWFDGNRELLQTKKMPEADLNLTAKYKVEYTVECYGQSLEDETVFVKLGEAEVGYDYVGKEFTSEKTVPGFREIAHDDAVDSLTLSADKSQNVFRHYFERREINVTFNSNYPTSLKDSVVTHTVKYETEIEIPSDYTCEGYCLAGWSTSRDGEVEYEANAIAGLLYNATENWEPVKITPSTDTVLFAVWRKGYTDMFGGNDYLFLLSDDAEVIYFNRGDKFFQGEYDAEEKEFSFINYDSKPNGETLIRGRLNANGTFVYYNKDKAAYTSTLYRVGIGLVQTDSIQFGQADEITYYVTGEEPSKGTYKLRDDDLYEASFTSGPKAGTKMVFTVGVVTVNDVLQNAFRIRNESEYALQELPQFAVYFGQLGAYYPMLSLDGFGTAKVTRMDSNGQTSSQEFVYLMEGDLIRMSTSTGQNAGVIKVCTIDGLVDDAGNPIKGYSMYTAALDATFEVEGGGQLTLDGMFQAVYKNGDETVSGFYGTENSVFGGMLVSFQSKDFNKMFHVNSKLVTVPGEDGQPTEKVEFVVTEKNVGYVEYHYIKDGETIYAAPLIVMNDNDDGIVYVYGFNPQTQQYPKVLEGTVTYDEKTQLYTYTVTKYHEDAVYSTELMDLSIVKGFVFSADSESYTYNITFWHSYETEEGTQVLYETYKKGDATLTLVAGMAIYVDGDVRNTFTYKESDGILTCASAAGAAFFELNKEEKTFEILSTVPYNLYLRNVDGTINQNKYLRVTGHGQEIVYYENGVLVPGTYNSIGENDWYQKVSEYVITATGEKFKYITYSTSTGPVYSVYDSKYDVSYTVGNGGRLVLDGYGYLAYYYDENGAQKTVTYLPHYEGGKLVRYTAFAGVSPLYFDITGETTATVRGTEYGTYTVAFNQFSIEWTVSFDGYGKYEVSRNENEKYTGTYTVNNGAYELSPFKAGAETFTWIGKFYGGKFLICHSDVVQSYIHTEDWSVIILDDVGSAIKYNSRGVKENGHYFMLDDDLIFYENDKKSDGGTYVINKEKGTIEPLSPAGKSYYSKDLAALQFTKFGYVVVDGQSMQYFHEQANGDIVIYRRPNEGETVTTNKYGFVESNIGAFDEEMEYLGTQYYANSIFGSITFNRDSEEYFLPTGTDAEGNIIKAKIANLYFTPTGAPTFSVRSKIDIVIPAEKEDEEPTTRMIDCVTTRTVDEETGESLTYVYVYTTNGGYYKIGIEIEFNGVEASTYEITSVHFEFVLDDYRHYDLYYQIYLMAGADSANNIENMFGTILLHTEYKADGTIGSMLADGTFKQASGLVDYNGDLVSFKDTEAMENADGTYSIRFEGKDGRVYRLIFALKKHDAFRYPGYDVVALVREETLVDGDYSVTVGRVVVSDKLEVGETILVGLSKADEEIGEESDLVELVVAEGKTYYVVRTVVDGKITSTQYYGFDFTSEDSTEIEEGKVLLYTAVKVKKMNVATLYNDKGDYVDYDKENGKILFAAAGNRLHRVESCTGENGNYTVVTTEGRTLSVKIDGETVTITEVIE